MNTYFTLDFSQPIYQRMHRYARAILLFQNNALTKPSQTLKPMKHVDKIILHDSAIKITR